MRSITISLLVCGVLMSGGAAAQSTGGPDVASNEWKFDFHGYLRAPMRLGLGHQDNPPAGQSANTVHYPLVPDDQYMSWQYTGVQAKDWSELFFGYGNQVVKGTVGLQGYNFTDASWQNASAQFGISQGWVTLTPNLGFQNVRLEAKAGAFWSRYGMAGKYDAGKYDTYLFGRTHQMGETVKLELDVDKFTFWAEQGFGAKQPDPSAYNPSKFTMLAHGHAGMKWNRMVDVGLHVLHAWSSEEDRGTSVTPLLMPGLPSGSMTILGGDLAVRNTLLGDLYLGYSHIGANHATAVTDIVEVIHAGGGGTFQQGIQGNYLETHPKNNDSHGNGSLDTVLFQYDVSLANLLLNLKEHKQFWGDGPDLTASLFMMYNAIKSDDSNVNGNTKVKFGVDVLASPIKWLGVGMRVDRVQPNSRVAEQSFTILSPRVVFKSAFVTHEEISLQYSRYLYNTRECAAGDTTLCVQPPSAPIIPNGFGAPTDLGDKNRTAPGQGAGAPWGRPDLNTIKFQATMWW